MKLFFLENVGCKLPKIHLIFESASLKPLESLKEDQNVRGLHQRRSGLLWVNTGRSRFTVRRTTISWEMESTTSCFPGSVPLDSAGDLGNPAETGRRPGRVPV